MEWSIYLLGKDIFLTNKLFLQSKQTTNCWIDQYIVREGHFVYVHFYDVTHPINNWYRIDSC